jgi:hypothetical protein
MADDSSRAVEERHLHKLTQHSEGPEMAESHAPHPVPAPAILSDARLGGRGHAGLRSAAVQRMQQTLGNRATRQLVQRAARQSSLPEPGEDVGARIQARTGGGSALDAGVQRQLEHGLGSDLSGVRVHTDAEADHLARSVDSVAFTTGSNIFFRSGMYNPGTDEGLHLLAHEATHTVQQAAGPVAGTPTTGGVAVSDPGDSFEQSANAAAGRVLAGAAPTPAQTMRAGTSPTVQRQSEDEEPVQTMRDGAGAAVQRAEEDEEPVQAMRTGTYATVQREGAAYVPVQAMRTGTYAAVQREGEEEEPMQTMRTDSYAAVQRAEEEEEPVQALRTDSYAVQRQSEEEEI